MQARRHVGALADVFGLWGVEAGATGEAEMSEGETATQMLLEAADYIASTLPTDIDPRAWRVLLGYAPRDALWSLLVMRQGAAKTQ